MADDRKMQCLGYELKAVWKCTQIPILLISNWLGGTLKYEKLLMKKMQYNTLEGSQHGAISRTFRQGEQTHRLVKAASRNTLKQSHHHSLIGHWNSINWPCVYEEFPINIVKKAYLKTFYSTRNNVFSASWNCGAVGILQRLETTMLFCARNKQKKD